MKINDIFEIKIEKLVFGGEGIGYHNELTIFVPMSVPGDILKVKLISLKKTYGRALIEEIISPSEDRIEDLSKVSFEDFSGCDFAMLKYDKQVKYKEEILKDTLKRLSKINIDNIEFLESKDIKNYRNKVAEPFIKINGNIKTGFFQKKSHNIFTSNEINLKSIVATDIMNKLFDKLNNFKGTKKEFKVYNEIFNTGFLKTCIVRNNEKDEVMLVIVVNKDKNLKRLIELLKELYKENDNLKSIYISVKEKQDNVIFGENTIHVCGDEYISEEIFDIKFKIYPDSFFQINKSQTLKMYKDAIDLLGDYNSKNIIDAFSGTGTIAMIMSKRAKKVIGIEMTESSVKAARLTSKENGIKNVSFVCSKVEDRLEKIVAKEEIDYIVFDPPRKGIEKEVLKSVSDSKIEKIIYISCNPATLARDIQYLIELGYRVEKVKGYDMFPQTHHIETVVLLERK